MFVLTLPVVPGIYDLVSRQVGNLVDVISSRPRHRNGFSMSLVGNQLHVVLAMVSVEDGSDDAGFDARSLKRIIEELCHEVG